MIKIDGCNKISVHNKLGAGGGDAVELVPEINTYKHTYILSPTVKTVIVTIMLLFPDYRGKRGGIVEEYYRTPRREVLFRYLSLPCIVIGQGRLSSLRLWLIPRT